MSKAAQVVILGEDQKKFQQNLIRKYLTKRGFSHRQIRDIPCPVGQTPGINFVFSRFATEVQDLRIATYSRGLVVAIDGDDETVETRKSQLNEKLKEAGKTSRSADEAIAIIVPKRNVETWIWYLEGNAVDESTNYKKTFVKDNHNLSNVKAEFADYIISGREPAADCPASLQDARIELRRIEHR